MKVLLRLAFLVLLAPPLSGQFFPLYFPFNQDQDTLHFSDSVYIPIEYGPYSDGISIDLKQAREIVSIPVLIRDSLQVLDSVQIDGLGAEEIVFRREINFGEWVHGGTYDGLESTEIEIIEIWNLDTKEQYWSGVTLYDHDFVGSYNVDGRIRFVYAFSMYPSGEFEVKLQEALYSYADLPSEEIRPALKSGKYRFKKGRYVFKL